MECFDSILYINLSHRFDRRVEILSELEKAAAPMDRVIRIDAIHDPLNGHRGCAKSHLAAIEYALDSDFERVLILEDDFEFTAEKEDIGSYTEAFFTHFENSWDVFFLGTNVMESEASSHPSFQRVIRSNTAHGYAINRYYLTAFKQCLKFALTLMERDQYSHESILNLRTFDHVWKVLQQEGRWYIGNRSIGKQRLSFSDTAMELMHREQQECPDDF